MVTSENIPYQQDKLDRLIQEFREEYGTCLDWIFSELDHPENLGYSPKLIELFKPYGVSVISGSAKSPILHVIFWFWNGPKFFDKNARQIKKLEDRMKTKKLALEYLQFSIEDIFRFQFKKFKNIRAYKEFMLCYFWLERLYYISANRNLHFEDALDIYFSGIIEKLILGLDEFDKLEIIPEPDCEFFHKFRKVGTKKDAEKFKNRIGIILQTAMKLHQFKGYIPFKESEDLFLNCLAAFSAVNSDRKNISIDDHITAYKTYYKLLKTDLTQYKCQKELFNDKYNGYLVCKSCGSYYELKRGERPDDFTSCHCGYNVKYVRYLKDNTKIEWKSVTINSLLFTVILIIAFKLMNILYFMIIGIFLLILTTGPTAIMDEQDKRGSILEFSLIIILSFLLSAISIQLFFNYHGDNWIIFIPMVFILTLDLIIILKKNKE